MIVGVGLGLLAGAGGQKEAGRPVAEEAARGWVGSQLRSPAGPGRLLCFIWWALSIRARVWWVRDTDGLCSQQPPGRGVESGSQRTCQARAPDTRRR